MHHLGRETKATLGFQVNSINSPRDRVVLEECRGIRGAEAKETGRLIRADASNPGTAADLIVLEGRRDWSKMSSRSQTDAAATDGVGVDQLIEIRGKNPNPVPVRAHRADIVALQQVPYRSE